MESTNPGTGKALLLIDFQRDFLAEDGRIPVARHQIAPVIAAANLAIEQARRDGRRVIAIGNEFRHSDWIGNLLRQGAAVAGSPGTRWDTRVGGGDIYFPKWKADAFCNPDLGRYLDREAVGEVGIAGLYAGACVTATARAALARGIDVTLIVDALADRSDAARDRAVMRLVGRGAAIRR